MPNYKSQSNYGRILGFLFFFFFPSSFLERERSSFTELGEQNDSESGALGRARWTQERERNAALIVKDHSNLPLHSHNSIYL